jgi:SpoIID/LytB domain protein
MTIEREPVVAVGLMSDVEAISFELHGDFVSDRGESFKAGNWRVGADAGRISLTDSAGLSRSVDAEIALRPMNDSDASFTIRDIVIGIRFHWERKEDQRFRGALRLKIDRQGKLIVINDVPVESYLACVISSEMSAAAHTELLKAHAIISRSWLLAQIRPWKLERAQSSLRPLVRKNADGEQELIRWYDREAHADFNVCADDHCQRYQGVTKALKSAEGAAGLRKIEQIISATFGSVLVFDDAICDARFSKSCGGTVEEYRAAWEDVDIPYLTALYDGQEFPAEYPLPLTDEANAERWIKNSPPAFCHTSDRTILQRILPDFDQETTDFYRWRVTLRQDELQALLHKKLGVDFGVIHGLAAVERGHSGRIVRLKITGAKETMIIGKELEIRRALSPSHLYSSAFVVQPEVNSSSAPDSFALVGAGWGHGVGLCQIGAALMAEGGDDFERILGHYYPGAQLSTLYPRPTNTVD